MGKGRLSGQKVGEKERGGGGKERGGGGGGQKRQRTRITMSVVCDVGERTSESSKIAITCACVHVCGGEQR